MNLSDFRTRVMGTIFGGNSGSAEAALVDSYINEGIGDVLMRTHCRVDEETFVTTSGTDDYHMDQAILAMNELTIPYQSENYLVPRKTPFEIMRLRQVTSTAPDQSWVYALQGADTFMLYPSPTGETVTYWFVPKPTELSADTDDPSAETFGGIASEYHPAIEFYALWRTAEYDDHIASGFGERFRVRYEGERGNGGWLARIRYSMIKKGGRSLAPIVLHRRRRLLGSDPSRDWSYL